MEDYLPGEWFSPMLDGTNVEGKFKTRKGLVAMKKGNLQVSNKYLNKATSYFKSYKYQG